MLRAHIPASFCGLLLSATGALTQTNLLPYAQFVEALPHFDWETYTTHKTDTGIFCKLHIQNNGLFLHIFEARQDNQDLHLIEVKKLTMAGVQ